MATPTKTAGKMRPPRKPLVAATTYSEAPNDPPMFGNLRWIVDVDATQLRATLGGETFDEVISMNLHAGDETKAVMQRFHANVGEVLEPGGMVIVGTQPRNAAYRTLVRSGLRPLPYQDRWLAEQIEPYFHAEHPRAVPYRPRLTTGEPFLSATKAMELFLIPF
jgi:hypothetical protein